MSLFSEHTRTLVARASEALVETLWPTRCAVCDTPGSVLCARCERELAYLDRWRACPRCGAAFGLRQCTECSSTHLERLGRTQWPFAGCASATVFDAETGRIVRVFKDQGEQRLAAVMARIMARALPPAWADCPVSFIPASTRAAARRGFDHAELIARSLAREVDAPLTALFERPHSLDQRTLSGAERVRNLQGRFVCKQGVCPPPRVLLIDDVFTTGATLCDATDTLLQAGTDQVFCLTFARVM